ncbi:MAG: hypothetical protein LGB01_06935 [Sulfurovum sp.]|nr:hypothetical protein [Sulfurovum sp.]
MSKVHIQAKRTMKKHIEKKGDECLSLIFAYGILPTLSSDSSDRSLVHFHISDWGVTARDVNMLQQVSTAVALAVDVGLIVLFGLQHSGMARRGLSDL